MAKQSGMIAFAEQFSQAKVDAAQRLISQYMIDTLEKDIYPIRLGEIVWIHPKGRLVSVKTTVRGGQITETFRPWEVMPE